MVSTGVLDDRSVVYCELRFRPNVQLVSVVRRFVSAFYERTFASQDVIERLALATHELLENAVKYSCNGETAVRIEVEQASVPWKVCIRTWNRTTPGHRAVLDERFRRFQASTDVFGLYQELMQEASKRDDDGSGLGLARICAEADMTLGCEANDDEVCIVARTAVMQQEHA